MTLEHQIQNLHQFTDEIHVHSANHLSSLARVLTPYQVDLAKFVSKSVRDYFSLPPNRKVVITGEQTYGLNGPDKVLAKRLVAKKIKKDDLVPFELFASYDVIGSESPLYRIQFPHPQGNDGHISINVLPGWKHRKNAATYGFKCPTPEDLQPLAKSMSGLYGELKTQDFINYISSVYSESPNYAVAQLSLLRILESRIGLQIEHFSQEQILDTQIAQYGGMELILQLWPSMVNLAKLHPIEGVRHPNLEETPFHLYHHDNPDCFGRMKVQFTHPDHIDMESPLALSCMECGFTHTSTPAQVIESNRPLTWRAVPRVIAYSVLGIADGHITGGGSIYNQNAAIICQELGLPYFPLFYFPRTDSEGNKIGPFSYQSAANIKGKGQSLEMAQTFVREGKASMADLILSVGIYGLNNAITDYLTQAPDLSPVICPPPLLKGQSIF